MKKILLIGKTGQLGAELMKDAGLFHFSIMGFSSKEMNVLDKKQIEQKLDEVKPDVLINTSAYHVLPACEENPLEAFATNSIAVQDLAILSKKRSITFATYSTDYVFDGTKGSPYEEDDAPNPLQIYGLSKWAGECATLGMAAKNSFVIRTCGVYGGAKGSPRKGGNFVLNIMKESDGKEALAVSSEQIVNPTYAGDLSKATLNLLAQNAKPGIYHLANEGHCSWHEFTKEIFSLANIRTPVHSTDKSSDIKMKRPTFSALKNTKAKALGIDLPSWQEGLKSYFKFLYS